MANRQILLFLATTTCLWVAGCGSQGKSQAQVLREKELMLKTRELSLKKRSLDIQEQGMAQAQQSQAQMQEMFQNPVNPDPSAPAPAPVGPASMAPSAAPAEPASPAAFAAPPSAESMEQQKRAQEIQEKLLKQLEAIQKQTSGATPDGSYPDPTESDNTLPATRQNAQSPEMQELLKGLNRRSTR